MVSLIRPNEQGVTDKGDAAERAASQWRRRESEIAALVAGDENQSTQRGTTGG